MTEERMHRAGRRKVRSEWCREGERLQRRQQHHHKQASFSPLVRRWPRHVKSASPPAESEGLSPLERLKVQTSSTSAACVCDRGRRSEEREGVAIVIVHEQSGNMRNSRGVKRESKGKGRTTSRRDMREETFGRGEALPFLVGWRTRSPKFLDEADMITEIFESKMLAGSCFNIFFLQLFVADPFSLQFESDILLMEECSKE
uniref:Uncharacterized protein n=1 Tax=Salix viminalis TaxID=40686 RepID=A0A6N2LM69_SALVM